MKKYFNTAIEKIAASIFLINWILKKIIFIHYLLRSKYICLGLVVDIFARDEYRKDDGNLPQIYAMISINWGKKMKNNGPL